jgi:hypothetical protein
VITQIEPIRKEVVVHVSQRRAFEVFTSEMTTWWDKEHHIGSAPIEEIVLEPRNGGRWYTRHTDGSETSTGFVVAWEPDERVVLAWQLTAQWTFDPGLITTVELRFVVEAPDRTRVELEHRDLDRFGPDADRMRKLFAGPGAWQDTLRNFAAAVEQTD